jgi:hypothetical protein
MRILMGTPALILLLVTQVFAAGGRPIERFIDRVAQMTSMPEYEVRERAIEALRRNGYKREDLIRIRTEKETTFSATEEKEMVSLLQHNRGFRLSTGIEAIRINSIASEAEAAFIANAKKEAFDEFRTMYKQVQLLQLNIQTSTLQRKALETLTPSKTHEIHVRSREIRHLEEDLKVSLADLLYTLDSLLKLHQIPFIVSHGQQIWIAGKNAPNNWRVALDEVLAINVLHQNPLIVIDPSNLQETTRYVPDENRIYLGFDTLRSVTSVSN